MFLRVFRFDAKDDYEFYYKPYKITPNNDASVLDALHLCALQDRYFAPSKTDFYLKIGGKITHTSAKLSDFYKFANGDELVLSPLSEKYALRDFAVDEREFLAVYEHYFAPLFSTDELAAYRKLSHLFFATCAREIEPRFMGDSALIFAAQMLQAHPERTSELKSVIFSDFGLRYAQDLRPFLHADGEYYESIKSQLKAMK